MKLLDCINMIASVCAPDRHQESALYKFGESLQMSDEALKIELDFAKLCFRLSDAGLPFDFQGGKNLLREMRETEGEGDEDRARKGSAALLTACLRNYAGGRLYPQIHPFKSLDGRAFYSRPAIMCVPKSGNFRNLFYPGQPDLILLAADFKAIEVRIISHFLAETDHDFFALAHSADFHSSNAEKLGLSRDHFKNFFFGYLYGAKYDTMAKITGLPVATINKALEYFLQLMPRLTELKEKSSLEFREGKLKGIDGRSFPAGKFHCGLLTLLRSTASYAIKAFCTKFIEKLNKNQNSYEPFLFLHDELIISIPSNSQKRVCSLAKEAVSEACHQIGLKCTLELKFQLGQTWGTLEDLGDE